MPSRLRIQYFCWVRFSSGDLQGILVFNAAQIKTICVRVA
jgi:hypothetical protein